MIGRACSKCGAWKPFDKFRPDPRGLGGMTSQCNECKRAYGRAYAKANPPTKEAKRAKDRRYYQRHKVEFLAKCRAYEKSRVLTDEQRERRKAVVKRSQQKRADRVRANDRAWREANRDYLNAKARERYAADPVGRSERGKRRRALFLAAQAPGVTSAEWHEIVETFNQRCAYCLCAEPLEMDHVIALTRGGSHSADNVVPACERCNSSKRNRRVFEIFNPRLIVAQRMRAPLSAAA